MGRRARVAARDLARTVHPRLDPTTVPLVMLLGQRPALRMSELAAELSLDKSTVSRQVDAAARLGLVERVPDPHDSRARLVVLTDEGHTKITAILADRRKRWRTALHTWNPRDVTELTRLLRQLSDTGIA